MIKYGLTIDPKFHPREVEDYGMSVNVWAGVWHEDKTAIITYDGTHNATEYQVILPLNLLPNI